MNGTDIAIVVMSTFLIVMDSSLLSRGSLASRALKHTAKIQIVSISLGLALSILLHNLLWLKVSYFGVILSGIPLLYERVFCRNHSTGSND